MSGENIPNDLRNRPQIKLTLDPRTIQALALYVADPMKQRLANLFD